MTRAALEHLLRAAAALTNESEFVVIGSQAILGQFVRGLLGERMASAATIADRLGQMRVASSRMDAARRLLRRIEASAS